MQYLYVIQCKEYFKIGFTSNVPSRLSQLYIGNPFEMGVVCVYGFPNAESVEQVIHQKFSRKRTRGEWFLLENHDLVILSQICEILNGQLMDYEFAVSEEVNQDEISVGNGWRSARKNMGDQDVSWIAKSDVEEISEKYSLSSRTALNWKSYAKRELE